MKYREDYIPLPVFTNSKLLRELRQKKYEEEGMKLYQNIKCLTEGDYNEINIALENGDEFALNRLMELSVASVIRAVAFIYAKHDLDEILPYEEALSNSLDRFNTYLQHFKKLPCGYLEYTNSLVNYYVFKFIKKQYGKAFCRHEVVSVKRKEEIVWEIDHQEADEIDVKHLFASDMKKAFEKVCSKSLTKQQVKAIKLRYGLETGETMTFAEISHELNLTRTRAKELVDQALKNIKKNIKPLMQYKNGLEA